MAPSFSTLEASCLLKSSFLPRLSASPSTTRASLRVSMSSKLDVGALSHKDYILEAARLASSDTLSETHLHKAIPSLNSKSKGKVRDIYEYGDYLVIVTTDRLSAFDRVLASIPFKGQVLNEISLWWFDQTRHITQNAVISSPDKNVTISRRCSVFPVEFVVRGYVTGSTDTSLWTVYNKGIRNYCGNPLPDGLVKNQQLAKNILTPTTKAKDHDVPVTPDQIISQGLMTQDEFDEARAKALALFEYGQVHTPDSSRYWIAQSYQKRLEKGLEPENVDKEFLRLWFKDHCNPYEDEILPNAPLDLVCELAWRYIFLYEKITNKKFELPRADEPVHDRISRNVSEAILNLV
ncbi:phosphoribosylaminoimidazole-succinocarboxamide synthase, chloroplastic isoform X2 [Nymphaea colorata]|uniref:phosphoribosylaminoimidazole-succinocarboxamide synthase, chloroplastic isoform X2 n=1 Tax=Nymphaea colorata TaxID=210225 RepID=UPI00214F542D|nr:phosphoribosylaminoimidazole-succinocarboxamide synthase, chloroplastic isoform X2 [Nymphaea colorata]